MAPSKPQGPGSPPRSKSSAHRKRHSRTKPRQIIFEDTDELPPGYELRPMEDEEYPGMPVMTSGTLSSLGDSDDLPVVEPGLSIEPQDLGRQFLRDATEQDNFESELEVVAVDPGMLVLGQVVSEATLEASGHDRYELPSSSGLVSGQHGEAVDEPNSDEVNLMSNVVREASLFDQPTDDGDTREPSITTDDHDPAERARFASGHENERRAEFARTLEALRYRRERGPQGRQHDEHSATPRKHSTGVERGPRR